MKTLNRAKSADEEVLCDILNWIEEGLCNIGPYNGDNAQLQFCTQRCYEASSKPTVAIDVYRIQGIEFTHIGMIAPIHNEETDQIEGWMMNRKTNLGYFVETAEGPISQVASSAVNFFLVDADVIKRCYESNRTMTGKLAALERTKEQEDGINEVQPEPQIQKVKGAERPGTRKADAIMFHSLYQTLRLQMDPSEKDLGKETGFYSINDCDSLKGLTFECFVSGNERGNFIQCMVLRAGEGRFPQMLGTFHYTEDGFVEIKSRFYEGITGAHCLVELEETILTYLVNPHANNRAK